MFAKAVLESRALTGIRPWMTGSTVPGPLEEGGSILTPTRISDTAALRVTTVWACVRLIADAIAAAPIDVYRKTSDRRIPLQTPAVLADPAAGAMTSHDWYFSLVAGLLLAGNAYAFKADLDPAGYPRSLPLLDPTRVRPNITDGVITSYNYRDVQYPADRILHVRAFTLPGKAIGLSPLEQFGQTIGMAAEAERFAYQFFSEGAVPSSIIYSDKELTVAQATAVKRRILQSWRNRREPAILGSGLKYEPVSANLNESQFVESQHFTIEEICRIFGVRPEKVGHASSGSNVTYANIESGQIGYQIDTVYPWASRVETALCTVLPRPQFAKLNLDAQIRVDLLSRYKAHGMALRDGWDNADHRRALEDLEPLPNGQGKTYLWPVVAKPTQEPSEPAPTGGQQ